jgi:hypothetical protein
MGINSLVERLRSDYEERYQSTDNQDELAARMRRVIGDKIVRYQQLRSAALIFLMAPMLMVLIEYAGMCVCVCVCVCQSLDSHTALQSVVVLEWQDGWVAIALGQLLFFATFAHTAIVYTPHLRLDRYYSYLLHTPAMLNEEEQRHQQQEQGTDVDQAPTEEALRMQRRNEREQQRHQQQQRNRMRQQQMEQEQRDARMIEMVDMSHVPGRVLDSADSSDDDE